VALKPSHAWWHKIGEIGSPYEATVAACEECKDEKHPGEWVKVVRLPHSSVNKPSNALSASLVTVVCNKNHSFAGCAACPILLEFVQVASELSDKADGSGAPDSDNEYCESSKVNRYRISSRRRSSCAGIGSNP
jgi:hypothetical protein